MLCDVLRVLSCLYNIRKQGPRVVPKFIFPRQKLFEGGPRLRQMISCRISICKISGMSRTGEAKEDFSLHHCQDVFYWFQPPSAMHSDTSMSVALITFKTLLSFIFFLAFSWSAASWQGTPAHRSFSSPFWTGTSQRNRNRQDQGDEVRFMIYVGLMIGTSRRNSANAPRCYMMHVRGTGNPF